MAEIKGIGHQGYQTPVKGKVTPLHDNVLVTDMSFDERVSKGGIVILSDDGKTEGIRHRWARVWAIGPEQQDVKVNDWILIEHGRWTRGIKIEDENGDEILIRRIDTNAIIMISDEKPGDNFETYSSHTTAQGQVFTPEMFAKPHF